MSDAAPQSEVRYPGFSEHKGAGSISPLEMAVQWLLNSGIFISRKEDPNFGAVYSHYLGERGRHDLVYAEATGYLISLLKLLHARNSAPALVSIARASGDWLVRWAGRNDGIIAMGLREGKEIRKAYAFDNGICCKGLLDLYELTTDERYLRCAERIANWIVDEALNEDGSIKSVYDIEKARFIGNRRICYEVSGSFHAKVAMSLLQLSTLNHDERFEGPAARICDWAIGQQRPDGRFPVNKSVKTAYLHFHCYTVEALLYAYACRRVQRLVDAAEKGIDWVLRIQAPDGALPGWYDGLVKERTSEVQAQAARIFSLMNMLKPRREIDEASKRALDCMLRLQAINRDERTNGGFFEGSVRKYRLILRQSLNLTSWATMFAIHALSLMEGAPVRDFFSQSRFLF